MNEQQNSTGSPEVASAEEIAALEFEPWTGGANLPTANEWMVLAPKLLMRARMAVRILGMSKQDLIDALDRELEAMLDLHDALVDDEELLSGLGELCKVAHARLMVAASVIESRAEAA